MPFVAGSFALGYFSIGPYLTLRCVTRRLTRVCGHRLDHIYTAALTGSRELARLLRISPARFATNLQNLPHQQSAHRKPPLRAQGVPRGAGEALRAGLVHTQRAGTPRPRPRDAHPTVSSSSSPRVMVERPHRSTKASHPPYPTCMHALHGPHACMGLRPHPGAGRHTTRRLSSVTNLQAPHK